MSDTDLELLARYAGDHAEDAFAELVRRHLGLVYSAALRQIRSPQLAEEVAQSTFIKLARQAQQLAPNTILTAWLYQVTRREAIDVIRREARRQSREQIATEMNAMNATAADWTQIEPLLDEAMHALDDTDRTAVLLRYFENKSVREVGATLGASETAAQKRLGRAVERLREFFAKHGITVGASGLVVAISANAVQAAPVGLAVTISTAASCAKTVSATSTLAKAILMITTKQKLAMVLAIALLLLLGGTVFLFLNRSQPVPHLAMPPAERQKARFEVRWVALEGDLTSPADVLPSASTNMSPQKFRVLKDVILDGNDVMSAGLGNEQAGSRELVLGLTADGARKLAQSTTRNIGRRLAIVWNDRVLQAPTIRSPILGPRVNITGAFSDSEAQTLLDSLNHH